VSQVLDYQGTCVVFISTPPRRHRILFPAIVDHSRSERQRLPLSSPLAEREANSVPPARRQDSEGNVCPSRGARGDNGAPAHGPTGLAPPGRPPLRNSGFFLAPRPAQPASPRSKPPTPVHNLGGPRHWPASRRLSRRRRAAFASRVSRALGCPAGELFQHFPRPGDRPLRQRFAVAVGTRSGGPFLPLLLFHSGSFAVDGRTACEEQTGGEEQGPSRVHGHSLPG
jgi:hypothetical protein